MKNADNLIILAGHYCLAPELSELSNEGASEQLSFEKGVKLFKAEREKGRNVKLYIWVNDIGVDAGVREEFRNGLNNGAPDNYREIAQSYGIQSCDIKIVLESVTRNRATKELRKIYKLNPEQFYLMESGDTSLVRCVDSAACGLNTTEVKKVYAITGPAKEHLVVKEGPNPKCSLILATLFQTLAGPDGKTEIVSYFNEIYVNRLRLGLYVYSKLFSRAEVSVNTYFCSSEQCIELNLR